jgi:hypothetical protein
MRGQRPVGAILLMVAGLLIVGCLPALDLLSRVIELPTHDRSVWLRALLVFPYLVGLTFPISMVTGAALLLWGAAAYAAAKGYHPAWGLVAGLTVVGIGVLAWLPSRPRRPGAKGRH